MIVAATVMALGGAVIATAVVRLDLMDVLQTDTLGIVVGFALLALGAICVVAYWIVRAIGWAVGVASG